LTANTPSERQRYNQKCQVEKKRRFPVAKTETQDREVNRLRPAREGISNFRPQTAPNKDHHQYGYQSDGEDGGESHGEGLCPGKGPEHSSFLGFQKEHGQKRNENDEQRKENRWANLFGCAGQNAPPFGFRQFGGCLAIGGKMFREVTVAVLDHDDGGIDEYTNRKRQSSKRHDV
jgi:hypothetical protein